MTNENKRMRITVVGGGKMGEAILSGWIASKTGRASSIEANDVLVVEPGAERRDYLSERHGVSCVQNVSGALDADMVILSVKPQVMPSVLEEISADDALRAREEPPLFVSIAAGIPTETLAQGLPEGVPIVRVMPNMPLMVGEGASGVCAGAAATAEQLEYVADLFGCLGRAVVVDEADMDVVCALSGSGPAYVAAMIEALRDAASARGLDAELAETLALQTVLGTAQLIAKTDLTTAQAREAVCSPGGTTLAALDAMNEAGFASVFDAGVEAAVRRSKELAQCSS